MVPLMRYALRLGVPLMVALAAWSPGLPLFAVLQPRAAEGRAGCPRLAGGLAAGGPRLSGPAARAAQPAPRGLRGRLALLAAAAAAGCTAAAAAAATARARSAAEAADAEVASRRQALARAVLVGAAGCAAAPAEPAAAFQSEELRLNEYVRQARQLNEATDWFLFELRPLVYPANGNNAACDVPANEAPKTNEEVWLGDKCPERNGLLGVTQLYKKPPQPRGSIVLSLQDRLLYVPLKLMGTSTIFDPDTEDDLRDIAFNFEQTSEKIPRAAAKLDFGETRRYYDRCVSQLNKFFFKVNTEIGAPKGSEFYLQQLPNDSGTLEEDYYWIRRRQKWLVKKKVDAVAKANKTARFYAKSMFGEDAVSWDVRGDGAADFYSGKGLVPKN